MPVKLAFAFMIRSEIVNPAFADEMRSKITRLCPLINREQFIDGDVEQAVELDCTPSLMFDPRNGKSVNSILRTPLSNCKNKFRLRLD